MAVLGARLGLFKVQQHCTDYPLKEGSRQSKVPRHDNYPRTPSRPSRKVIHMTGLIVAITIGLVIYDASPTAIYIAATSTAICLALDARAFIINRKAISWHQSLSTKTQAPNFGAIKTAPPTAASLPQRGLITLQMEEPQHRWES